MSKQTKKKHAQPLGTAGLTAQAEYARAFMHVKAPHGVTKEDVMAPAWWQHHAARFDYGDRVEVRAEDGSFWIELGVIDKGIGFVKMRLLWEAPPYQKAASPNQDHLKGVSVNWGGPNHKWRILKGHDVVRHGFNTKEDAEKAAVEYLEKAA